MPAPKIQDREEVLRWIAEGRTYAWMVQQYREKYGIDVAPSMFGNFRQRQGIERRINRDETLIPWAVEREHRWSFDARMLRAEARRRTGAELREPDGRRLAAWKARLAEAGEVIEYTPADGFQRVPLVRGVDDVDVPKGEQPLIRRPAFLAERKRVHHDVA